MKKTLAVVASAMASGSTALAHPGSHLHPHGESFWLPYAVVAAAVIGAAAFAILVFRKSR